ncbi:MAG: hypothetical protein M0R80_08610 [Proteobacteria bacterium]|jgi:hypothetical protein|nr:hypothetical protein [Pseudomonadota bacterium]
MKNIEYFVGKICSVFTTPLNRDFKLEGPNSLEQLLHYFLGTIDSVDDQGILLSQRNGRKAYVFKSHLVAIAEEEVLDPDNPEDAKIIREMKPLSGKKLPQSLVPTEIPVPKKEITEIKVPSLLNIDSMAAIADNLKKNFGQNV